MDAGAEHSGDCGRARAQFDHGFDGSADDVIQRAFPAGVAGADHLIFNVGEQNHTAIGSGGAKGEVAGACDQTVGAGAAFRCPRF